MFKLRLMGAGSLRAASHNDLWRAIYKDHVHLSSFVPAHTTDADTYTPHSSTESSKLPTIAPLTSSHTHGPATFTGHPCLLIAEIFDQIVRDVYDSGNGKGSVASLAATCQSFHVPAICILWEKMDSIVPLIKTLPDGFWGLHEIPHSLPISYHTVSPLWFPIL